MMVREVDATLEFACCRCERPVIVRVKCSGKGLDAGPRALATIKVPCPNCNYINQLYFEPTGKVRLVTPGEGVLTCPLPSSN
jgi:hypothetical protein